MASAAEMRVAPGRMAVLFFGSPLVFFLGFGPATARLPGHPGAWACAFVALCGVVAWFWCRAAPGPDPVRDTHAAIVLATWPLTIFITFALAAVEAAWNFEGPSRVGWIVLAGAGLLAAQWFGGRAAGRAIARGGA